MGISQQTKVARITQLEEQNEALAHEVETLKSIIHATKRDLLRSAECLASTIDFMMSDGLADKENE